MTPQKRIILGGIGALLPIIVSLTVVEIDITTIFDSGKIIGAIIRDTALFIVGGIIGYAHEDEEKSFKLIELGVAAPALVLTLTTSHGLNNELNKVNTLENTIEKLNSEIKTPIIKGKNSPVGNQSKSTFLFDFSIIKSANAADEHTGVVLAGSPFSEIIKGIMGDVSPDLKKIEPIKPVINKDDLLIKSTVKDIVKDKIYEFSIFINPAATELNTIQEVQYYFNHPSFITNKNVITENAQNNFLHKYKGWGCLTSIDVTITYKNGTSKKLDFDMCKSLGVEWE